MNLSRRARFIAAVLLLAMLAAPLSWAEPAKPLASVLPDDALVIVWSPNPSQLIKSVNEFTPGNKADIPPLEEELSDFPVAEDFLSAPTALALFPRRPVQADDDKKPYVVLLVSVADPDALAKAMGELDAEGIYEREGADEPFGLMMVYQGYAAFSDDREALKALAAAADKPYVPTEQAAKLMETAQVFAHVNIPLLLEVFDEEIKKVRAGMEESMEMALSRGAAGGQPFAKLAVKTWLAMFDGFFELAKELKSFDEALEFSAQGLKIATATTVTEGGRLSAYLVPGDGVGVLEPPLPALEDFLMAAWARCDQRVMDRFLADYGEIAGWALHQMGDETDRPAALVKAISAIVDEFDGLMGERFAFAMSMSNETVSLAEVLEVRKPDEFKAIMRKTTQAYNEVIKDFLELTGEDAVSIKYVYQPDAKTIAGVNVDRLDTVITAKDPEEQAQLETVMNMMYGAGQVSYLLGVVDDKAVIANPEKEMERTIGAVKGRVGVDLLRDDPIVKSTVKKMGLDNDAIFMLVPARFLEFNIAIMTRVSGHEGNAPMPLPFATPAVFGLKAADQTTLRFDAYVPQATVAECVTVVMSMMMAVGMGF